MTKPFRPEYYTTRQRKREKEYFMNLQVQCHYGSSLIFAVKAKDFVPGYALAYLDNLAQEMLTIQTCCLIFPQEERFFE
jgi:hypothetical protein